MIKYLLFDFDGTIVNTNDVIIESFQATYEHFYGGRVDEEKITRVFGEPLMVTMARDFPMVSIENAMQFYRQYQFSHADELVKEFPGIKEMLDELKDLGYKMVIVTSRTTESTLKYLNMFNLAEYFDDIVSCDDTTIHKPNPEPIYIALSKLNAKKEEAIMIGDGHFDIKCANNAGVKSILVGWRITADGNPLVGECKEDYISETPKDIVKLLKELNA